MTPGEANRADPAESLVPPGAEEQGRVRWIVVTLILSITFATVVVVLFQSPPDPLFRGRPESEWIAALKYNDDEQVTEWRTFGPEGVRVLVRGLRQAQAPWRWRYRSLHAWLGRHLPPAVARRLPNPAPDTTRKTRMDLVSLLARLGRDAPAALPWMLGELRDPDASVRQIAVSWFTQGEDENSPVNRLDPATKTLLLRELLRLMDDPAAGVRNNVLVALRHFPGHSSEVVPVLRKALNDPNPRLQERARAALRAVESAK